MKRILSAILVIALILSCVAMPASAESWTCPDCSRKNSDNFCPDCGAKKPEPLECNGCGYKPGAGSTFKFCPKCGLEFGKEKATPTPTPRKTPTPTPRKTPEPTPKKTPTPTPKRTFEITSTKLNNDGTVTVKWEDSASNGPYRVCYKYYVNGDLYSAGQREMVRWTSEENCYGKSYTLTHLVPGTWYWIMIYDSDDNLAYTGYRPSKAKNFSEFGVSITMDLKRAKGSTSEKVKSFSAAEITGNNKYSFGAYIRLDYSRLKKERHYVAHVAITAPDGSVLSCSYWDDFDLPSGKSNTYWKTYSFDSAFETAVMQYDEVPTGTYTWSLYFDGKFVNSHTFRVKK